MICALIPRIRIAAVACRELTIWRARHIIVVANSPQLFGEQGIGELANSIDEQGIGELAQTIGKQSIGEPRPTYWRSLRLVSTLIHSFVFF